MSHPFAHIPGVSFDHNTQEPFLALPAPLNNYRLTPWRESDADIDSMVSISNDRRVYMNLLGPPFPYHRENAVDWIAKKVAITRPLLQYLRENKDRHLISNVSGCPFEVIRFSQDEDLAGGHLLGVIDARINLDHPVPIPYAWTEPFFSEADFAGKHSWSFGDYLSPEHHRKGIMSACVKVLLEQYYDPIMRIKSWEVKVLAGNWASRKVFEKNGFQFVNTVPEGKLAETKGEPVDLQSWVLNRER